MQATLTFNLPDEVDEYRLANYGSLLAGIVYDFTQLLREKTKYGDGKPVGWEEVKEAWWMILKESNYDPYES